MSMVLESRDTGYQTLAERLSAGALTAEHALRIATEIGEAIRTLHDSGMSHGGLSLETILLTAEGLELVPPVQTPVQPVFAADILAFGAILARLLGNFDEGRNGIGALIAGCSAPDPATRFPTMQKALLELRVAGLSLRHSGVCAARQSDSEALRGEMEREAARQAERIRANEISVAENLKAIREEIEATEGRCVELSRTADANASQTAALQSELNSVTRRLAQLDTKFDATAVAIERQFAVKTAVLETVQKSLEHTDEMVLRVVEAIEMKLAAVHERADSILSRLEMMENRIKAAADQNVELETRMSQSLHQMQTEISTQVAAVESLRQSMSQTDDLVGRVVDAVESILDVEAVSR